MIFKARCPTREWSFYSFLAVTTIIQVYYSNLSGLLLILIPSEVYGIGVIGKVLIPYGSSNLCIKQSRVSYIYNSRTAGPIWIIL